MRSFQRFVGKSKLGSIMMLMLLATMSSAVIFASCGSDDDDSLDPDSIPRERTFIVMTGGEDGRFPDWENFNNFVPGGNGGWHTGPLQTMAEPLIMFNLLSGEHEFWTATAIEHNANFDEVTLTLRDDVFWADGEKFTADDVAFTFNTVAENQDMLTHIAEIHLMDRAEVIDDTTVRFYLKQPSPSWWVNTLTSNHGIGEQILPEHVWNDKNITEFTFYNPDEGWPFSTGPFELVSASPEQKVFVRRDDWWAAESGFKPLPEIEKVIYLPSRDEAGRSQAIIRNEVDSMQLIPVDTLLNVFEQNPTVISWSRQDPPYGYLDWCPVGIFFNNASSNPVVQDKNVRWAVNYALSRREIVDLAEREAGFLAYHMITPYTWFDPFEERLQRIYREYSLDEEAHPELVIERMEASGYSKNGDGMWQKNGQTVDMNIPFPGWLARYGVHVVKWLQDAGFNATLDQTPGAGTEFGRGERDFNFGCKGPSGVLGADPYYMLSLYSSETFRDIGDPPFNPWATSRYRNPQLDQIVSQMKSIPSDDPRTLDLFEDAMEIWFDDMPDVYIAQLIIRHLGNEEYWTGWPTDRNNYGQLHPWQQEFLKTTTRLKATK